LPPLTTDTATLARSDEPGIWHRPAWLRAPLLALLWAALLAYGSLLPLGFDFSSITSEAGGVWVGIAKVMNSPGWITPTSDVSSLGVPVWVSDLLLNLAMYVPLGVLLRLTASRLTGQQWVQVVSATLVILIMSWVIESAQSLVHGRYGSLQDILSNTTGGLIGVLLGHTVNSLWRGGAFVAYRLTARPMRWINNTLLARRARVLTVWVVLLFDACLITCGYLMMSPGSLAESSASTVSMIPFEQYFQRSYDVGVLLLGRTMVVYGLAVGALLMLPVMQGRTRRALVWVTLSVSLMAIAAEVVKPMTVGIQADVTGPVVALIAGAMILTMGFMLVHACRHACRRREELTVRVERRGQQHDYRFALRPDKAKKNGL